MTRKNPLYNHEGYKDPTAYQGLKSAVKEEKRIRELINTINHVAHLAGYDVVGGIKLKERNQK